MDTPSAEYRNFSAEVRLQLRADNRSFDLASIGPNEFIPRQPLELAACDAEVVMFIDGTQFLWPVRLPHGAVPFDSKIMTESRGCMQRIPRDSK